MAKGLRQRWYVESTNTAIGINVDEIVADAIEATESARCETIQDGSGTDHRAWECSTWTLAEHIRRNPTIGKHVRVWVRRGNGPLRPAPAFDRLRREAGLARRIVRGSDILNRGRARAST